MSISKAVITAAGPDQHTLPLQTLVDRDGRVKTALELIVSEAVSAGVDEVCIIIQPSDADAFSEAAGEHVGRLQFVEQSQPRGYGDALFLAREFVGDQPFLHLVSDHLYLSSVEASCARQLVEMADAENCSVSAVQATRENMLPYFGAIHGRRIAGRSDLYEVTNMIEKPTPTQAEQELIVAGLRSGYYLCMFGMHVMTPTVMSILGDVLAERDAGNVIEAPLANALFELSQRERYLALQVRGVRHNMGMKYGLLTSQLALALSGQDRDLVLTELVELLATGREL